ncbi:MAG: HAMP domain-containing sensor histidine kinase [Haloplanus sp.]
MHSAAREASSRSASAVVSGFGVALASAHAVHAAEEVGANLSAVFYGSVVPFAVAVGVVAVGLWIDRREWAGVSPWRLVGWCGAGAAAAFLLVLLHIRYQLAEGVVPEHRGFVSLMFVTCGAGLGLLVGGYDLRVQEAQSKLAEKTRRLDEFASIVSHDLRNPLNVAQGYVELAQQTGDVSDLDHVVDAHDRIAAILADMLALARDGEGTVSPTAVDLDAVAEEAWAMVVTGDTTLTVTADVTLYADRGRLKTLFENPFRNSVEHGSTSNRAEPGDSVEHGSRGDDETRDTPSTRSPDEPLRGGRSGTGDAADAPVDVTVGRLGNRSGFYVEDTGHGVPSGIRERVFEAASRRAAAAASDWPSSARPPTPTTGHTR